MYVCMCVCVCVRERERERVKLVPLVKVEPKAHFSIATTPRCRGGRYSFPWIAPLDTYLIYLSVKQGSIKYHFLSLWYDPTCE